MVRGKFDIYCFEITVGINMQAPYSVKKGGFIEKLFLLIIVKEKNTFPN